MKLKTVKTFYDLLGHKKQTEIRAIELSKDFKTNKVKGHYFVSNQADFVGKVREFNGMYNLYAGLNERVKKGTEAKDVISVKRIFVDIDCIKKPATPEDLKEAEKVTDEIISKIEDKTGFRATKIYSGNGYQLIYCIPEIEINDDNREEVQFQIQQFLKDLIKKYSNDKVKLDNVGDLPRIIRITGTTNIKGKKVSEFIEVHNEENPKLRDYILSLKPETSLSSIQVGELETSLKDILDKDEKVKKLFEGDTSGFLSRSEAEESLVFRLVYLDLNKNQVWNVMSSCGIGKWQEANESYRELTYKKAIQKVIKNKSKELDYPEENIKQSNPFKKLHYTTEHLSNFEDFNRLIGLLGKHYLPLKKARYYQLVGGIIQKKINLGGKFTDTRLNCIYPLPTEQGKNDFIYVFKDLISEIRKNSDENFKLEEPLSYHPEQLVGKVIEALLDNPRVLSGEVSKPKKIKKKIENRGYFNADFVEIDESNSLFFQNDEQTKQAREYISKALNPIGRNEVVKKLVDDLPTERVCYSPKCTFTLYFQPKKIKEELILQGFLRRFLIPVGSIEPFLNYGNEDDFKIKISSPNYSREDTKRKLIKYLSNVRRSLENKDFTFEEEAREKINYYLNYLIAEGQVHSERIASLTKLIKWTIQDYLIKMSCIIAGSFYQNVVTEDFVSLAYMDLVELLQSTFDFYREWVIGNFDYGVGWKGAFYKDRLCLEYLYEKKCFSPETSEVSISDFGEMIMEVFGVKGAMARKIYDRFKKEKWIMSKQIGSHETRVWLNFTPQTEKIAFQGDKGDMGANIYNSVFLGINDILSRVTPITPITPTKQETINFLELDKEIVE